MLLAACGLTLGPEHLTAVLYIEAILAVLALWALGRRLWTRGPWALLAAGLYLLSPLAVWVQRTPLTEPLTGLLLLAAALALVRGWREQIDMTVPAALLLGATGWIRGNAWITAIPVFAVLWLSPQQHRRLLGPAVLFLALVASLAVHVATSYPYLHDELARQLGRLPLTLTTVAVAAALAATAWLLVDRLLRARRGRTDFLPGLLLLVAALAILVYAARAIGTVGAPWSRLDPAGPLLGASLLITASLGALILAATRLPRDPHLVWLAAVATIPVTTLALYAQRNLPHATLYYYGRYLVPELLPLACLLAAAAVAAGHSFLCEEADRKRRVHVAAAAVALALLGAQAWPYVATPVTRLQEFVGAERAIDVLAAELPEDAVVIAGGEGWHSAHTFNQIGGALALGHGRTLLPYRSSEAAYAALHELLLGDPTALVRPRVFLLLNEASHVYRPLADDGRKLAPVAAIDDRLPPPFVARPRRLVELFVDRLTPVEHELPIRVTRDALRMALLEVEVDPELQAAIRTWDFTADAAPPPGVTVQAATWTSSGHCLDPVRPLVLELTARPDGPVSLVLVAGPGGTRGLGLTIDDEPIAGERGPRDTLGPVVLAAAPRRLELLGDPRPRDGAACPHGSLASLRLLPPDTGARWSAATADAPHAITSRTSRRPRPPRRAGPLGRRRVDLPRPPEHRRRRARRSVLRPARGPARRVRPRICPRGQPRRPRPRGQPAQHRGRSARSPRDLGRRGARRRGRSARRSPRHLAGPADRLAAARSGRPARPHARRPAAPEGQTSGPRHRPVRPRRRRREPQRGPAERLRNTRISVPLFGTSTASARSSASSSSTSSAAIAVATSSPATPPIGVNPYANSPAP
jgi:hypothetical protein